MKRTFKLLFAAMVLAVFLVFFCLTAYAADGITAFSVNTASASYSSELGAVKWYKNAADGKYYIFLPGGQQVGNMKIWFSADSKVMCGGKELVSGTATDVFAGGGEFKLTCGGKTYDLVVLQADGIGTVYINTESGSLDYVHANKDNKDPGDILIVDADGKVQYNGVLEYIKGRGNSTWNNDKKPYNIKLDKKTDLFGMGKSKKWCMLANASDNSLIRNALAFDLAQTLGVTETSDTVQVNMYINGNYEGVYMITEKVEIGENRVDIYDLEGETEDVNSDDLDSYKLAGAQNSRTWGSIKYAQIPNNPSEITGGYLLELEKIYRYVNEPSGFITDIGQAVVVKTPEFATKAQVEYISEYYQEFEDALYSPTGYNSFDKHYSDYIDVESLARMYILAEFCSNFDGCSSSFFLYKDVGGKLVAGPAWDYDLSLGTAMSNDLINHVKNVAEPSLLYIQTCFIGNHNENKNALLAQAFSHNEFQDIVERIWNDTVTQYIDTFKANIDVFSEQVRASAVMNAVRWNIYGTANTSTVSSKYSSSVNVIRNFVNARYPFLSDVYSPDTHFVKYDVGRLGATLVRDTTVYRTGDTAVVLAAPKASRNDVTFLGWSTSADGSGTLYKAGDKITMTANTKLYAQWKFDTSLSEYVRSVFNSLGELFKRVAEFFKKIA